MIKTLDSKQRVAFLFLFLLDVVDVDVTEMLWKLCEGGGEGLPEHMKSCFYSTHVVRYSH